MTSPIPADDQNPPSAPNGASEEPHTIVEYSPKQPQEQAKPSSVVSAPRAASPVSRYSGLPDDDNPYTQIIDSLRAQNNELFGQVTQLNAKLVQSYDRVSDLEDTDHLTQAALRNANLRVAQLEMERMEHLSALDTGLLVERAHVTQELSRLMEKVSEESAQRGLAENAKQEIEKDLDDLSASLFNQANTMVAEARFARAQSEKKAAAAETAMKGAEEAVALMQSQMQSLTEAREKAEREAEELRARSGVGEKRIRTTSLISSTSQTGFNLVPKLMKGHAPYEEFVAFLMHLRGLRSTLQHPPLLSSIISLPFLARLINEDSDPTLRLDLAPSLNWLTRRNIAGAVQQGQLTVEPMQSGSLLMELATHSLAGLQPSEVACALCGKSVLHVSETTAPPPSHPSTNTMRPSLQNTAAVWASTSRFLRSSLSSSSSAPNSRSTTVPPSPSTPSIVVYVFRLSLPAPQRSQPYALCASGWCLTRLRATCELWRYVRTSVIDKVWEEDFHAPASVSASTSASSVATTIAGYSLPPVPPRRKSGMTMGGLLGKGLGALGMDVGGSQQQTPTTSTTSTMSRQQTAPPALASPPVTSPPATQGGPPPPPRRVPPLPMPAPPPRSASRPNLSASPAKEPVPLPEKEEEESFATPRTSMEKPDPFKDAVVPPSDGAVVLNEEPITAPEKKPEEPVRVSTPVASPAPARPPRASSPVRPPRASTPVKRPSTPSGENNTPSAPSTPTREPALLPSTTNTPVGASPSAPPPLPRRAATRKAPAPNRASMLVMGKEKDVLGEKERRNSIGQMMADFVPPSPADLKRDGKQSSSRPGTPANDRAASPAPGSPLKTAVKRASLAVAPAEISPLTMTASPADDTPKAEEPTAKVDEVVPPPLPPRDHEAPPVPSKQPDGEVDGKVVEEDERVVITDRTWEDRAWKELTRLKVEMFWARVGGIQVPSS